MSHLENTDALSGERSRAVTATLVIVCSLAVVLGSVKHGVDQVAVSTEFSTLKAEEKLLKAAVTVWPDVLRSYNSDRAEIYEQIALATIQERPGYQAKLSNVTIEDLFKKALSACGEFGRTASLELPAMPPEKRSGHLSALAAAKFEGLPWQLSGVSAANVEDFNLFLEKWMPRFIPLSDSDWEFLKEKLKMEDRPPFVALEQGISQLSAANLESGPVRAARSAHKAAFTPDLFGTGGGAGYDDYDSGYLAYKMSRRDCSVQYPFFSPLIREQARRLISVAPPAAHSWGHGTLGYTSSSNAASRQSEVGHEVRNLLADMRRAGPEGASGSIDSKRSQLAQQIDKLGNEVSQFEFPGIPIKNSKTIIGTCLVLMVLFGLLHIAYSHSEADGGSKPFEFPFHMRRASGDCSLPALLRIGFNWLYLASVPALLLATLLTRLDLGAWMDLASARAVIREAAGTPATPPESDPTWIWAWLTLRSDSHFLIDCVICGTFLALLSAHMTLESPSPASNRRLPLGALVVFTATGLWFSLALRTEVQRPYFDPPSNGMLSLLAIAMVGTALVGLQAARTSRFRTLSVCLFLFGSVLVSAMVAV